MSGILGLFFAVAIIGVGFFGGRAAVARAYGIRDRRAFSVFATWLGDAAPSARIVAAAGSFFGTYLAVVMALTVVVLVEGINDIDETSMRVAVAVGGPGSAAGMKDGDRITSVEKTPVHDWATLKQLVATHSDETIDVVIERDGVESVVHPIPKGNPAKIMVGPFFVHRSAGIGEALVFGIVTPFKTELAWAGGLARVFSGKKEELSGPVGIVAETSKNGAGAGIIIGALLVSAYAWAVLLFSVVSVLGAKKKSRT